MKNYATIDPTTPPEILHSFMILSMKLVLCDKDESKEIMTGLGFIKSQNKKEELCQENLCL